MAALYAEIVASGRPIPAEEARSFQPARRRRYRRDRIVDHRIDGLGKAGGILSVDERTRVAKNLRQGATIGRDDRHADRHRFENRQTEPFLERGLNE